MAPMRFQNTLFLIVGAVFLLNVNAASAESFTAKVIGVSDGDTITVISEIPCNADIPCNTEINRYRVRLAAIDTPEKKQPYGTKAKAALSDLVFGQVVRIESTNVDRYGRLIANVYVKGVWVNSKMVSDGCAWVYRAYSHDPELLHFESIARAEKRGLWALPEAQRIPPWEWRRAAR